MVHYLSFISADADADSDHDDVQQWKHDDSVGLHELKLAVYTDHTHSFLVFFLD